MANSANHSSSNVDTNLVKTAIFKILRLACENDFNDSVMPRRPSFIKRWIRLHQSLLHTNIHKQSSSQDYELATHTTYLVFGNLTYE